MKDVHLIALVIVGYLFGILVSVYKLTEAWTLSAKCNVEVEGTLVSVEKALIRESTVKSIIPMYQYSNIYTKDTGSEIFHLKQTRCCLMIGNTIMMEEWLRLSKYCGM